MVCDYFNTCNQVDAEDNLCLKTFKYCSIYNAKQEIDNGETVLGIGAVSEEDIGLIKMVESKEAGE